MRREPGLAPRIFAAQALVILAGSVTFVVVALVVTPPVVRDHLGRAFPGLDPGTVDHLQQALPGAMGVALGAAMLVATMTALAVSWFVSRRMSRPLVGLSAAARRLAGGEYGTRMADAGLGREFSVLVDAFNRMASSLDRTERTRRQLLADLAHELRTPLSTLTAQVEAVADGVVQADETVLSVIRAQTDRIVRLVDDLALVSQAEEGHLQLRPQPSPTGALIAEALEAARWGYDQRGVELRAGHIADVVVDVDPDRVQQVLANLLSNALRHTPAGGVVTVDVQRATAGVQIAVSDTGEGIAVEHLPRVFERFYRVDSARDRGRGGSGIGLAVSKAIVRGHGGTIEAHSDGPGRGSRFVITLPPRPGTYQTFSASNGPASPPQRTVG